MTSSDPLRLTRTLMGAAHVPRYCRIFKLIQLVIVLIVFACRISHADEWFVFCTTDATGEEGCIYPFEAKPTATPQLIEMGRESFLFSGEIVLSQNEELIEHLPAATVRDSTKKAVHPVEQIVFVRHCDAMVLNILQQHILSQSLPLQFVAEKTCQPDPNLLRIDSIMQWSDPVHLGPHKVRIHLGKIKQIAERTLENKSSATSMDIRYIVVEAVYEKLIVIEQLEESGIDTPFEMYFQPYITSALFDRQVENLLVTGSQNTEIRFRLKDTQMADDHIVTLESGSTIKVDRYAAGRADMKIF